MFSLSCWMCTPRSIVLIFYTETKDYSIMHLLWQLFKRHYNINHGWGLIVCRAPFLSVIQQTPTCLHCKKDHFHLPIKTKHNVKTYMWTKIKRYENSYNNQNIDGNQCYGSGIRHVLKNNITQRGWESIFSFLNNFWLPGPQPSPPDTIHEYYKCIN